MTDEERAEDERLDAAEHARGLRQDADKLSVVPGMRGVAETMRANAGVIDGLLDRIGRPKRYAWCGQECDGPHYFDFRGDICSWCCGPDPRTDQPENAGYWFVAGVAAPDTEGRGQADG